MNRRLVLMRHAKSDWSAPGRPDIERPLARRGRLGAPLMGAYLAEALVDAPPRRPHVRLSPSARTRETWARLAPLWPDAPEGEIDDGLYAEVDDAAPALASLRRAPDDADLVMILGHNPTLEHAVSALSGAPRRMPTAAIALFAACDDAPWSNLTRGRLIALECPKTLV